MPRTWIKAAKVQEHPLPQLSHSQPRQTHRAQEQRPNPASFTMSTDTHTPVWLSTTTHSYLSVSHQVTSHHHTAAPRRGQNPQHWGQSQSNNITAKPLPTPLCPQSTEPPHSYLPTTSAARSILRGPTSSHIPFIVFPSPTRVQLSSPCPSAPGFGTGPSTPAQPQLQQGPRLPHLAGFQVKGQSLQRVQDEFRTSKEGPLCPVGSKHQ